MRGQGSVSFGDMRDWLTVGCVGCRHQYRCAAVQRRMDPTVENGCHVANAILVIVEGESARRLYAEATGAGAGA